MPRISVVLAGLLGLMAARGGGETAAAPRADQASVDAAAKRGAEWLLQKAQGGIPAFPYAKHAVHSDTTWRDFMIYAMLHGGIDPNDPVLVKLINESLADRCFHTYQAVVRLQALHQYAKLRKLSISSRYLQTGQFLVDNQAKNGIWGYSEPAPYLAPNIVVTPSSQVSTGGRPGAPPASRDTGTQAKSGMTQPRQILPRRGWGNPNDLSNTQYALIGLWICMHEGLWPPADCLPLLETYLTESQKDDGGWGYKKGDKTTGSMTAGGVFCLGACLRAKGNTNPLSDPRVQKAVAWLGSNLTFSQNPGYGKGLHDGWHYYWIYSVERAGAMLDTDQFGSHRWYDEGVQYLLGAQKADGSWNDILDTGYAILFLKQATRQLVTYSGEHEPPKVFQQ